jgi:hypothetical protein
MKTITKNSELLPGYVKLIVIPTSNIVSIESNQVNVISNNNVYLIQCSIDSINHEARHIENENGKFYEHTVSARLQGYNNNNDSALSEISVPNVVLLLLTDENTWIRLGDKENALSFTGDFNTDKPGYDIMFVGELPYKSMPNIAQSF